MAVSPNPRWVRAMRVASIDRRVKLSVKNDSASLRTTSRRVRRERDWE
jgi:hypothetical protein